MHFQTRSRPARRSARRLAGPKITGATEQFHVDRNAFQIRPQVLKPIGRGNFATPTSTIRSAPARFWPRVSRKPALITVRTPPWTEMIVDDKEGRHAAENCSF